MSSVPDASAAARELAAVIDHTLLAADATAADIERVCGEARAHGFASVCVNGAWVTRAVTTLTGCPVATCSVIGFPLGAMDSRAKLAEAQLALDAGARELDTVIALEPLKAGDDAYVARELEQLASACHARGALLKVILECGLLDEAQKRRAAGLAVAAGAEFVKTSTGFEGGASVEDVALLRALVGPQLGVKASGGIRNLRAAQELLRAGANMLGTSAGLAILREA